MSPKTVYILLSLMLQQSCKHKGIESETLHNFGDMTASGAASAFWQPMTPESLSDFDQSRSILYPTSHPLSLRLNAWAEALHAEMLKTRPDAVPPRPQIRLLKAPQFDAFVSQKQACITVDMAIKNNIQTPLQPPIEDSRPKSENKSDTLSADLWLEKNQIRVLGAYPHEGTCITAAPDPKRLETLLSFFWGKEARCFDVDSARIANKVKATLDVSCLDGASRDRFRGYSHVASVLFPVIPTIITFNDYVLKSLSEDETVTVLAHELGHYYRLHGIENSYEFHYVYQLDASHNLGQRPPPASPNAVINALGAEVKDKAQRYLLLHPVPGQKLDTYFFTVFADRGTAGLCHKESCFKACEALQRHLDLPRADRPKILGSFPSGSLPSQADSSAYYRTYEAKALACSELIELGRGPSDISRWIGSGGLIQKVDVAQFRNNASLKDLLLSLSKGDIRTWIDSQNQEVLALFKKANQARLGIYTDEQEADEIGLELSSRVGISPESMQSALLASLKIWEHDSGIKKHFPDYLNYQQCAEARKQGFPHFVPIADYADPHHSGCFRIYNLFRETKAHSQDLKSLPPHRGITPDPAQWKILQSNI